MSDAYMKRSATIEWETPQELFDDLNREFNFSIDVAANHENAKLPRYLTEELDGLKQDWTGEMVWCNPPYGRVIADWVKKAAESKANTVMLVPARTDTKWFHEYVYNKAEIRFVKGRLKFGGAKDNAPFPSMIIIWLNNLQDKRLWEPINQPPLKGE
jgi:site-specific DNA-methyltransferase (adenine-specific)